MPETNLNKTSNGYFITGTDTNVGKTWATVALLRYFQRHGRTVVGMKPVASGCAPRHGRLENDDALLIQTHASVAVDYDLVNPYAYQLPISPHLAGADKPVELAKVLADFNRLQALADLVLVEGAGGWLSPITAHEDNSDLARALGLPVILVVAIRLGCINHGKLTWRAIRQSGLPCAGWIAMCTDPAMLSRQETIDTLAAELNSPLLGVLPHQDAADFEALAKALTLP